MRSESGQLNFERAAELRDIIFEIRSMGKSVAKVRNRDLVG